MRLIAGLRGALIAAVLALGLTLVAPTASADTNAIIAPSDPENPQPDSGWQAGTCNVDTPTCNVDSPDAQFFEAAAGHPPVGFTQFIVEHGPGGLGDEQPIGALSRVHVDLPPGLTVNPQATEQCTQAEFEAAVPGPAVSCPGAEVGVSIVTGAALGVPAPLPISAPVYNIEPPPGEPARFGFNLLTNHIYLQADLSWESDFHEAFTIEVPSVPLVGELILKNRLVFDGTSGDGTFITAPTTCLGEATPDSPFKHIYSTWLLAASVEEEEEAGYDFPADAEPPLESRIPPGRSPKGCDSIPFDPSIATDPNTAQTDSPSGATVTVELPEVKGGGNQSTSHVRNARVTLPLGMGLNPSAANGLEVCTDGQFGKGTRNPVTCPEASRIGTVEIDTPPLPDGSLSGPVYVGQQLSRDPTSGNLYRIFVNAKSDRFGVDARLLGKASVDPQTGQVTTIFDDGALGAVPLAGLPQVPFKSFRIKLDGGPTAVLTSPPTCGPNTTGTQMTPWSSAQGTVPVGAPGGPSTNSSVSDSSDFSLSAAPGGGNCPKTMAGRPFALGFGADTNSSKAATFTPLRMNIARADGNQELKGVDVTLPPGLVAKLKGVKYCPPSALAAAAASSGSAERASSSCPASSRIGRADVKAGSGPAPIGISGQVFLAGRYKGAPLSLAVITPATAGPFDLGTVVVRVALSLEPRTARVHAVSDPIPHVYGGATLDIRSVNVVLNRDDFTLTGTNCSQLSFDGSLLGGGANPLDPGAFVPAPISAPYKLNGCERLGFRPKLFLRLFGGMRRAKNPKLRAVLLPRKEDANIARAATILPRSLILDQANLAKVCTRVQFAANDCPKKSIYGNARAFSPLLDDPVEGPIYLRSSNNTLPDLVADLRGQVELELVSRTDSTRGRIRSTFDIVPDVPVSKFVLTLRGGPRGLLVNSRNQCPRKGAGKGKGASASKTKRRGPRAIVRFKAQNGKKRNMRLRLRTPCRKKGTRGKGK
jgi:hypothetical protein